jgi:hypothetical protein
MKKGKKKKEVEINFITFWVTLEVPVDDFLRHHYVDTVVRETRKKQVEYHKRHVTDASAHTLVLCNQPETRSD